MYIITKIDTDKDTKFLIKTYRGEYMFSSGCSSIFFKTEDAAYNFIFHNYSYLSPLMKKDDYLIVKYHEIKGDENDWKY